MRRLAIVVLLLVPVFVLAAPAGAEAPEATGWWSRTELGPVVPADLPSGVPDGGLYVAGDPTGPLGVSALRLAVGDRPVSDLVLELADVQGTPAVRACPTSVTWLDEQGGPMASAPAAACDRGEAVGQVADGAVRIAVGSLVVDGVLNVVLEPVPGSVFRATFQAPGDQSVTVDDGGSGAFDAIVDPFGSAPFLAPAPVGELAPLPAVVAPAPAPA
ncbi:MAG: hypothetical protein JWO68_2596, partial [Actinomycetia bacterium]|nr:hypothetical protein [Actinomycetes bacterium]